MINYKKTAFALVKPPSRVISYHIAKTAADHQKLIDKALDAEYCLYYTQVSRSGGKYIAQQPWQLDEATLPAIGEGSEPKGQAGTSKPSKGASKTKKPQNPKKASKPKKSEKVAPSKKAATSDGVSCPFCDKPMSSASGRTLHVKSSHPDRIQEYNKWLQSPGKKS